MACDALLKAGDAIARMGRSNFPPPLAGEGRVAVRVRALFAIARTSTTRGPGTPYFPPPPGEGRVGAADGFADGAAPRTAAAATGLGTACAARAGVSTVTGVGPAVPGGVTTVIAVGDSERMMPGVDPKSTWSESGTK